MNTKIWQVFFKIYIKSNQSSWIYYWYCSKSVVLSFLYMFFFLHIWINYNVNFSKPCLLLFLKRFYVYLNNMWYLIFKWNVIWYKQNSLYDVFLIVILLHCSYIYAISSMLRHDWHSHITWCIQFICLS